MCAHYTIQQTKLAALAAWYGIVLPRKTEALVAEKDFYSSRGKSQTFVPVVRIVEGERKLQLMRWDLVPSWWTKPLTEKKYASFNARSDSLSMKATFKGAWKYRRRCIMPARSFFEWPDKKMIRPGTKRMEREISVPDQKIFSIAAIWDEAELSDGEITLSCAMITTEANEVMRKLPHDRMPVLLRRDDETKWLSPSIPSAEVLDMLKPYPSSAIRIR